MDLQLREKVVIVTGGSSGIGRGIAGVLSREGAIPIIVGRNPETVTQAHSELTKDGGKAGFALAELTDPKACRRAVEAIRKEWGPVSGLVNNAGVNDKVGLVSGSPEAFISSINKNLTHYYTMAQLVVDDLKVCRGAIVNIGSKTACTGQGGTSGYAAANGGRNALTREWAVELLPFGIRVNAVIVAESYTPLYERWVNSFPDPEKKLSEITRKIPLGQRMTTPEEIGNTVCFLLSGKSSHTTGQIIYVDGGYTHLDRAIQT